MGTLTYSHTLVAGTAENINHVQDMFVDARTVINGNIDGDNLSTATGQATGVNATGIVRRGKSIIATEETRTNTAYGLLTTPDRVSSVVLPTDGIIYVLYQALWKGPTAATGFGAVFIGANQLKIGTASSSPVVQEAQIPADGTPNYNQLHTGFGAEIIGGVQYAGLVGTAGTTTDSSNVTTGQMCGAVNAGGSTYGLGYPLSIFASAGTYDITVQFKSASGTVSVKERKLWVWTMGF